MGIFNHGPLSRARKKIGGIVFQQYEGLQVGREYQPVVANPNTSAQIAARARLKLSNQLSASLFPWAGPVMKANGYAYKRFQRGEVTAKFHAVSTYDTQNQVAVISSLPALRPTGNTAAKILSTQVDLTGGHISGNFTTDYASTTATEIIGIAVLIPMSGTISVRSASKSLVNADPSPSLDFDSLPQGFQGSVIIMGYFPEATDGATSVTYDDIVGSTHVTIASLSTLANTQQNFNISNVGEAYGYQA